MYTHAFTHSEKRVNKFYIDFYRSFFYPFLLQDRHIPVHSSTGEPVIDNSQDYILMSAYENSTHTVMRFSRKLITCDEKYDVPITVSKPERKRELLQTEKKNDFTFISVPLSFFLIWSEKQKTHCLHCFPPRIADCMS